MQLWPCSLPSTGKAVPPAGQLLETVLRPLEALGSNDMHRSAEVKMIWWTLDCICFPTCCSISVLGFLDLSSHPGGGAGGPGLCTCAVCKFPHLVPAGLGLAAVPAQFSK